MTCFPLEQLHPYATMSKTCWIDRELLEVVSTEFRDRSTMQWNIKRGLLV